MSEARAPQNPVWHVSQDGVQLGLPRKASRLQLPNQRCPRVACTPLLSSSPPRRHQAQGHCELQGVSPFSLCREHQGWPGRRWHWGIRAYPPQPPSRRPRPRPGQGEGISGPGLCSLSIAHVWGPSGHLWLAKLKPVPYHLDR